MIRATQVHAEPVLSTMLLCVLLTAAGCQHGGDQSGVAALTESKASEVEPVREERQRELPAEVALPVEPSDPIPSNFKTFSLFLVPESWNAANPSELTELKSAFEQFGNAIGHEHVAVWFLMDGGSEALDFERMRKYSERLQLAFEQGPYVVTTLKYPDSVRNGDKVLTIQLANVNAVRATAILSILENDLHKYDEANPQFREQALELERIQQVLLSTIERESDTMKGVLVALIRFGR